MGNNESRVCDDCKKGNHQDCEEKDCACRHCKDEKALKWCAVVGGAAAIVGGKVLTVVTGGLAGPLVGAAIVGSGISSTFQGASKLRSGEELKAGDFLIDVGVGAITGLA